MKRGFPIVIISVMLSLQSCTKDRIFGNGTTVTEARNVSNFAAVSASGSTNVYIMQGADFKVELKGYNNLLPYYETRVVNNTLQLGYKQNVNVKNDNVEVFITMPVLNGISIYGSADVSTTGIFNGSDSFSASIAGSGNINFSEGSAQNFYSAIDGSGNIYALNMIADKAEITINGSGKVEITANSQLKVKINGSGTVNYKGTPAVTSDITGSGGVTRK